LLEGRLDSNVRRVNSGVVQALLEAPRAQAPTDARPAFSVSAAKPTGRRSPFDDEESTRVQQALPDLKRVPRVVATLALSRFELTPYEAWVVSRIDGHTPGEALQRTLDVSAMELRVVLQTLLDKQVVVLEAAPPAAAPPTPAQQAEQAQKRVEQQAPTLSLPKPGRATVAPQSGPPSRQPTPTPIGRRSTAGVPLPLPTPRTVTPARAARPAAHDDEDERTQIEVRLLPHMGGVEPQPVTAPNMTMPAPEEALQAALRLEQEGKLDEAVATLELAIGHGPEAAPLLNRLAIVLVRDRRDFAQAARLLKRALLLDADHKVYKTNLMAIQAKLQKAAPTR
jgi:type IV pilus assembly protein PilB